MKTRRLLWLTTVILLAVPVLGAAQVSVGVLGGLNQYKMEDINDELAYYNAQGLNFNEIESGRSLGAVLRYDLPDNPFALGVKYERLTGETEYSDVSGTMSYDVGGAYYGVEGLYRLQVEGGLAPFVGAGIGLYRATGEVYLSLTGYGTVKANLEAQAIGPTVFAGVGVPLSSAIEVGALAGYRIAETGNVDVEGINTTSHLDWTGGYGQVMLLIHF